MGAGNAETQRGKPAQASAYPDRWRVAETLGLSASAVAALEEVIARKHAALEAFCVRTTGRGMASHPHAPTEQRARRMLASEILERACLALLHCDPEVLIRPFACEARPMDDEEWAVEQMLRAVH